MILKSIRALNLIFHIQNNFDNWKIQITNQRAGELTKNRYDKV